MLWECGGTLAAPAIAAGVIHKALAFIAPKLVCCVPSGLPLLPHAAAHLEDAHSGLPTSLGRCMCSPSTCCMPSSSLCRKQHAQHGCSAGTPGADAFELLPQVGGVRAPSPVGELGNVEMTQALTLIDIAWQAVGPDMLLTGAAQRAYLGSRGVASALCNSFLHTVLHAVEPRWGQDVPRSLMKLVWDG